MQHASFKLTEQQFRWLEEEAARLGINRAELLRRLIDKCRGAEERRDEREIAS